MSDKENRSIAYIYDEMDPSEKLEFERDLQNDNDLLIEVESLKKVSQSLGGLQQIQPPDHLVEAVCETAQSRSKSTQNRYGRSLFYAVAAVILVGMTSGIFLIQEENGATAETAATESASVSSNSPVYSQPVITSSSSNPEPWIDNNEILYLNNTNGSDAAMDSIKNSSLEKLTPVTDPSQIGSYRYYQLTGTHN